MSQFTKSALVIFVLLTSLCGCGSPKLDVPPVPQATTDTNAAEIAISILGGAVNDTAGNAASYASRDLMPKPSLWSQIRDALVPLAHALTVTCSGGGMTPASYAGAGSYSWSPIVCTQNYTTGQTGTAAFNSTVYNYSFSAACTGSDFLLSTQPINCVVTRRTQNSGSPVGVTRTITGANGNSYAVTHDTNTPSGYNAGIATSAGGEVTTCGALNGGDTTCTSRSLTINGSHVTSTMTPSGGGSPVALWNHTVSSNGAVTINGNALTTVVIGGSLIVQDNNSQYYVTSTVTQALSYSSAACCFPVTGQMTNTFVGGPYDGKIVTMVFTPTCGQVYMSVSGILPSQLTLQHCL